MGEQEPGPASSPMRGQKAGRPARHDNPRWGYNRIHGELLKVGHDVSAMTIRNVLRRHGTRRFSRANLHGCIPFDPSAECVSVRGGRQWG